MREGNRKDHCHMKRRKTKCNGKKFPLPAMLDKLTADQHDCQGQLQNPENVLKYLFEGTRKLIKLAKTSRAEIPEGNEVPR